MLLAAFCLTAFVAAVVSGALGLGGGTLLVGVLFAAGLPPAQAVPLFAIVQLTANGTRSLRYLRSVHVPALLSFSAASLPAALLFAPMAEAAPLHWVQLGLGALILYSLLPARTPDKTPGAPGTAAYAGAGLLNGSIGMFIGATGLILGRLLLRPDWPRARVVGTIAATQAMGHAIKILGFAVTGGALLLNPVTTIAMCLAAVAGTAAGTRLGERLPETRFQGIFRIVLVLLAAQLCIAGIMRAWMSY